MSPRKQHRPTWTVNQTVAANIAHARLLRGWTQDQAAEAIAPYLGTRLSNASFSAIERSVDGGRVRKLDADEIYAFARGFNLPIGWFFTPPSPMDGVGIRTPDARADGQDPHELLDAVLGTDETLEAWRELLLAWPLPTHRVRFHDDGTAEQLGREDADVHPRLDHHRQLRAAVALRESLGDTTAAADVLRRLADTLDHLDDSDEPARADIGVGADGPARGGMNKPARGGTSRAGTQTRTE